MSDGKVEIVRFATNQENSVRSSFSEAIRNCPIPDDELQENLGLFLTSKVYSRLKFMDFLYQQVVNIHGVVMEFGTRWGQNMALFSTFRGMYEPFNRNRKILGFDTFKGFLDVDQKDGASGMMEKGKYSVTSGYRDWLENLMNLHEKSNPLDHIKKFEIIAGDAGSEVTKYLERQPETIIALAYFDMDLYKPTKECLEAILPHLTKGSVLGFDELNTAECPGETLALREVIGLSKYSIRRMPTTARTAYLVIE